MSGIRRRNTAQRRLVYEVFESRRLLAAMIGDDLLQPSSDALGIWNRIDQPYSELVFDRAAPAQKYSVHSLEANLLKQSLSTAPQENLLAPQSSSTISIPTPTGGFEVFEYFASSIMAPELAAQFPEIQTYAGRGVSDPAATIRFDLTPAGFHAQVLSPNGAYYVDPLGAANSSSLYATYFKSDAVRTSSFDELSLIDTIASSSLQSSLGTSDQSIAELGAKSTSAASKKGTTAFRSGAQLRTYRAAVAATGEYTAFSGGTVALGQAAIVTAMNRVNQIYENELSIRMVLVANNSSLVYTNASTDPYTNNDGDAMLAENQTNLTNVIGLANFDIGHVFSTGGGGVALLGSVGINSQKAQGVTGSTSPVNDSFWVDYVAHEMGHQFGGDHTFNSTTGSCGGGNRSPLTAYEPGSGSTIQAYAGICGADNLQAHSDPYFHSVSFDQIIAHVDTVIPAVGTRTATGNSVPTVNAGSDYTIPANTPFVLTATGADSNATNVLTYNWEQRNLGPAQTLAALALADNGSSPLFRSYTPTTDPTRTFPLLSSLVNNTVPTGERLPQTNRTLNFRATVRDNAAGGGGVNTDDAIVNVVNTGAAFAVTSPNTNVTWAGLSTQTITWNVAGTTANGINAANVNISLSTDGGLTYPTVLISNVPNDGSQDVVIPNLATLQARIRVQGAGNIFFDISNVNFTITGNTNGLDFGDAPDPPYSTTNANNGPRHTTVGPILGTSVDSETDGLPSPSANADGIDEDGVSFPNPLVVGTTVSFTVRSSAGGGELNYFFDFDGTGGFGNQANEIFSATLTGGVQTISVAIPANAVLSTFARFRISTAGGLGPTGAAPTGEVEDYAVSFLATAPVLDFGDAPSSTLLSTDGPRHTITVGGPRLGALVDSENDGQPNATSTGDGADDDGIIFRSRFVAGSTNSFSVISPQGGALNYFFDFDSDGVFGNNPNEVFQAIVPAGVETAFSIAIPATAVLGTSRARFRISTAGGLTATGLALDGEVEDYQILIVASTSSVTYESFDGVTVPSLPSGWSQTNTTTNVWATVGSGSFSAPNHAFISNAEAVSESILVTPSIAITNTNRQLQFSNSYNSEAEYDGGVLEISIGGGTFQDIIAAGGSFTAGGYNLTLFTGSGNPIEGRSAWTGSSGGYIDTVVELPATAIGQNIQLRWRFGSDESFAVVGWRIDNIRFAGTAFDFGDAPAPYPTQSASNGATHQDLGLLKLGTTRDNETDGQPTASANGDGTDEDGVSIPAALFGNTTATIAVTASVVGILNAWIDFNGNGSWLDQGEQITKDVALAAGSNSIIVSLPAFATNVNSFARFRFSTQSALAPNGVAPDGEVEDYPVILSPSSPIVNRRVFYNRSKSSVFGDGSENPTNAIDSSKTALLPGQTSSFANYTNYTRGLNGLIVDLENAGAFVTAADFQFSTWNGVASSGFTPLASVPVVTVFLGGGINGTNRIKIEFADNTIRNTWLRVTMLAGLNTGLAINDVFYFGNAVGDVNVGNTGSPITVQTNAADVTDVRQHQSLAANSVNVTNIYDINKDGRVNAVDLSLTRQSQNSRSIRFFTAPASLRLAGRPISAAQAFLSIPVFSIPTILPDIAPTSSTAVRLTSNPSTLIRTAATVPYSPSSDQLGIAGLESVSRAATNKASSVESNEWIANVDSFFSTLMKDKGNSIALANKL